MSGHQFPYKSQIYQMNTTMFQSMINNIGNRLRKMNLSIQFKSLEEKQLFQNKLEEQKDRNHEELDISEIQQNQEQIVNQPNLSKLALGANSSSKPNDLIIIPQNFQMSILLRQKFMAKLNLIGDRLNVKFMVVPNKVKIEGRLRDRVDEAQDEYRQLRQNICIQWISQYGEQIYQSSYYKKMLSQNHIEVIEILKKYYYWFNKTRAIDSQTILQKIFTSIKHKFYPLDKHLQKYKIKLTTGKAKIALGTSLMSIGNKQMTNELLKNIKIRLFYTIIEKQINYMQGDEYMHIQLSEDNNNIIMHHTAQEQFQIQTKNLDQLYDKFKHVFLMFPQKTNMSKFQQTLQKFNSQHNSNKFKKIKNDKQGGANNGVNLTWQIKQNYACISYESNSLEIENKALQEHNLLKFIRCLPQDLLCFKIVLDYYIEIPEEETWSKSFTFQKEMEFKGTVIGCKNESLQKFELMIQLYLQNKFSKEYIVKIKLQKTRQNLSQNSISMDITKPINQSSFMGADITNNNQSLILNQSILNHSVARDSLLPKDIHNNTMLKFQDYKVCINITPQESSKRWAEVQKLQKSNLPWKNDQIHKHLKQTTTFLFKLFRLKIPNYLKNNLDAQLEKIIEEKPDLAPYNRRVTIFLKQKQAQNLYDKQKKIKIVKLQKNYSISEGYLLQTNLIYILAESQYQLPFGRYEAIAYIKKMQ